MTLQQFIQKYLGKQVEYHSFDPRAKFQCADWVNQYIVEVLGLDPVIGTDAKDFPSKINKDQFEVIKNTPDFIPKAGDIAVWGNGVGRYIDENGKIKYAGHIAVVSDDKATLNTFNSVDQNWSKPLFVTLETHNYSNVSYFLRAKVQSNSDSMQEKNTAEIRDAHWNRIKKLLMPFGLDNINDENVDSRIDLALEEIDSLKKSKTDYESDTQTNIQRREVLAQNLGATDDWEAVVRQSGQYKNLFIELEEWKSKYKDEVQNHKKTVEKDSEKFESLNTRLNQMETDHQEEIRVLRQDIEQAVKDYIDHKDSFDAYMKATSRFRKLIQLVKENYQNFIKQ